MLWFILIPVLVILLILLISCICIVPQATAYVVEWLGVYQATWPAGLKFKVPFLMRVAKKVSLKEQVVDFKPQPVITRDNVTMQIDTVVFFQVTDAKLFTYGVERPMAAIENLTATTLRNIIGDMELDHTLTSRDIINTKITAILDQATDKWGIKVNRVEVKNIIPPAEIQDAMEKQMKAERASCGPRAKSAAPSWWPRAKRRAPSCGPTPCASSASARPRARPRPSWRCRPPWPTPSSC